MNWPYARDLLKQFPLSLQVCVCVCMWARGGRGWGMGRKKGETQVVPGFQLLFHK